MMAAVRNAKKNVRKKQAANHAVKKAVTKKADKILLACETSSVLNGGFFISFSFVQNKDALDLQLIPGVGGERGHPCLQEG